MQLDLIETCRVLEYRTNGRKMAVGKVLTLPKLDHAPSKVIMFASCAESEM